MADYNYPLTGAVNFENVLVPNKDNVVTEFLVAAVARSRQSVLLFGDPGTAKTAIINKFLGGLNKETEVAKIYNFSSVTKPFSFQVS